MTIAQELAQIALDAAESTPADLLRPYLLANTVVAAGADTSDLLLKAGRSVIGPGSRPGFAHSLASRMHFRTQDDYDPGGRVHVGAVVIPAVLAVTNSSPFPAMAAGYAVTTCVARPYRDEAEIRGLRPTGVFGSIGAAAAAGVGLGLGRDQLAIALELASALCGGTNQSWVDGSDEWLFEVAGASRSGVEAALLAREGLRGASAAFEGPAGWARAYFGDANAEALRKQMLEPDLRIECVALKRYPVSGIAQVPTALSAELGRRFGSRIPERFEIRMRPGELAYPGSANRGPVFTRSSSLMSVARCVSIAYLRGIVPLASLGGSPTNDESTLLELIDLVPDEACPEGSATATISFEGAVETSCGDGEAMLHPNFGSLLSDLSGLAERCEATRDCAKALAHAIAGEVRSEELRTILDARR